MKITLIEAYVNKGTSNVHKVKSEASYNKWASGMGSIDKVVVTLDGKVKIRAFSVKGDLRPGLLGSLRFQLHRAKKRQNKGREMYLLHLIGLVKRMV